MFPNNMITTLFVSSVIFLKNSAANDEIVLNVIKDISYQYKTSCIDFVKFDRVGNYKIHHLVRRLTKTTLCQMRPVLTESEKKYKPCSNSLNVVYALDFEIKLSSLYPTTHAIWLLFLNESASEFFENIYLTFDMEIIVARIKNRNLVELHEVYRVDKGFPTRVKHYGYWTPENGLAATKETLYDRRFDLEGKILKTGSTENWPLTTFKSPLDPEKPWDGLYSRIWLELEKLLNFTSINLLESELSAGIRINGAWNGLIGRLLRKEIDVIASDLIITSERFEVLDFTYPVLSSRFQVFFKQSGYRLYWEAIFKPFDIDVWLATITWILIGTFSLSAAYYFSLLYGFESHKVSIDGSTETFFFMIQTLCQQGSDVRPKSITCRILFFLCYLVSFVLITFYSASLVSSITYHSPVKPFDSFNEMLADGRYKIFVENNTAEYAYFVDTNDSTLQLVKEKLLEPIPGEVYTNDTFIVVDTVCDKKHNSAFFGVQVIFDYKRSLRKYQDCLILSFSKPLGIAHTSMALAKGNPYTGLINHYVRKMTETGVTDNIRKLIWSSKDSSKTVKWSPVEEAEVFQIFVYLSSGILVSIFLLILEKYYSLVSEEKTSTMKPIFY